MTSTFHHNTDIAVNGGVSDALEKRAFGVIWIILLGAIANRYDIATFEEESLGRSQQTLEGIIRSREEGSIQDLSGTVITSLMGVAGD